jgi:hypothetical protein
MGLFTRAAEGELHRRQAEEITCVCVSCRVPSSTTVVTSAGPVLDDPLADVPSVVEK